MSEHPILYKEAEVFCSPKFLDFSRPSSVKDKQNRTINLKETYSSRTRRNVKSSRSNTNIKSRFAPPYLRCTIKDRGKSPVLYIDTSPLLNAISGQDIIQKAAYVPQYSSRPRNESANSKRKHISKNKFLNLLQRSRKNIKTPDKKQESFLSIKKIERMKKFKSKFFREQLILSRTVNSPLKLSSRKHFFLNAAIKEHFLRESPY